MSNYATGPVDSPTICRVCADQGLAYNLKNHHPRRTLGTVRPLEARISDRVKVVGEMVLCEAHLDPEVVTPDMWQPGARMIPR